MDYIAYMKRAIVDPFMTHDTFMVAFSFVFLVDLQTSYVHTATLYIGLCTNANVLWHRTVLLMGNQRSNHANTV